MDIRVRARIHPTEDPEKVRKAVENLFPGLAMEIEKGWWIGRGEGRGCLRRVYELLRSQGILDSGREVLVSGARRGEKTLTFALNKQAAYMGVLNLSEESPLGPIRVEIAEEDLEGLIDWLTPSTRGGSQKRGEKG
jgi:hypothetical protein